MAQPRNKEIESKHVDTFFQEQGRAPSSEEEWKTIHTASYGTDLPEELASLDMYKTAPPTPTLPAEIPGEAPPASDALMYRGQDISDTALQGAAEKYGSYDQPAFLDKVKERMQEKFKPETETLGLGTFSSTLGPLDPSGVMKGINEKSGQFRRKGALMLQALSTANDVYSSEAQRALDKMNMLEGYRDSYEQQQKGVEQDFINLAVGMAEKGIDVPPDLMNLLPPKYQQALMDMPGLIRASDKGTGGPGESRPGSIYIDTTNIPETDLSNCVYYARSEVPELPTGLWTYEDKKNIINSQGAVAGSAAVIDVGDKTGHMAVVQSVNQNGTLTISETNYKTGQHSIRTGTPEELGITGYFVPERLFGGSSGMDIPFEDLTNTTKDDMRRKGYDPMNAEDRRAYYSEAGSEEEVSEEQKEFDDMIKDLKAKMLDDTDWEEAHNILYTTYQDELEALAMSEEYKELSGGDAHVLVDFLLEKSIIFVQIQTYHLVWVKFH